MAEPLLDFGDVGVVEQAPMPVLVHSRVVMRHRYQPPGLLPSEDTEAAAPGRAHATFDGIKRLKWTPILGPVA